MENAFLYFYKLFCLEVTGESNMINLDNKHNNLY